MKRTISSDEGHDKHPDSKGTITSEGCIAYPHFAPWPIKATALKRLISYPYSGCLFASVSIDDSSRLDTAQCIVARSAGEPRG
jgi:hypothetical protein